MGPLTGINKVELASIGPAPFCRNLLADLSAFDLGFDIERRYDALSHFLIKVTGLAAVNLLAFSFHLAIELAE